jgi:hypothetical protein
VTTLTDWFNANAKNLAGQLDSKREYVGAYPKMPWPLFYVGDKKFPQWAKQWLDHTGVLFITFRAGEEANYIVFLTREMDKFHETYLVD